MYNPTIFRRKIKRATRRESKLFLNSFQMVQLWLQREDYKRILINEYN